jgi:hypothetical protein
VALALLLLAAAATPVRAQGGLFDATGDAPAVSPRAFLEFSREWFRAERTFDAVFDESSAQFWGVGGQVTLWHGRIYGDVSVKRLVKNDQTLVGTRVFVSDNTVSKLGIPLRVKIEPLEFSGGYRFNAHPRVIPYVGVGIGSYHYTEESDFATDAENLDVTKRGSLFHAGVELRAARLLGVAMDAQYTHVPGILGEGGVSAQFAEGSGSSASREADLGGWAARFKVVVGR